jgi:hypothetical protein
MEGQIDLSAGGTVLVFHHSHITKVLGICDTNENFGSLINRLMTQIRGLSRTCSN